MWRSAGASRAMPSRARASPAVESAQRKWRGDWVHEGGKGIGEMHRRAQCPLTPPAKLAVVSLPRGLTAAALSLLPAVCTVLASHTSHLIGAPAHSAALALLTSPCCDRAAEWRGEFSAVLAWHCVPRRLSSLHPFHSYRRHVAVHCLVAPSTLGRFSTPPPSCFPKLHPLCLRTPMHGWTSAACARTCPVSSAMQSRRTSY